MSHVTPFNADQILADRCPVCGSLFPDHQCHGWDDW
jgi:hypothetical protein